MNGDTNFRLIGRFSPAQRDELFNLYQREWWTDKRTRDEIDRMLAADGIELGLVDDGGRLVAFARVLTDGIFKALIFDVIVDPQYRGTGLGERLMDEILVHDDLRGVRHFELYCRPEMEAFYARWGFSTDVGGVTLMRRERSSA